MNKTMTFHMTLRDAKPKVWRKVKVFENMSVADFAYIVLTVFEMKASHLLKVTVPVGQMQVERYKELVGDAYDEKAFLKEHPDLPSIRYRYELLDIIDDVPRRENDIVFNIRESNLTHAVSKVGEKMDLWYDFGDDWYVDIELTELSEEEDDILLPKVIDGAGFGMLEDCGGIWMLNDIVKAYKTKKSRLYKDMSEWLGMDDFDFSSFDVSEMNERLQVVPAIFKRSYEERKVPTDAEIRYIDRE